MPSFLKDKLIRSREEWKSQLKYLNGFSDPTKFNDDYGLVCSAIEKEPDFIKGCFLRQHNRELFFSHVHEFFKSYNWEGKVPTDSIERFAQHYINEWFDYAKFGQVLEKGNLFYVFSEMNLFSLSNDKMSPSGKINSSLIETLVRSIKHRSIKISENTFMLNNYHLLHLCKSDSEPFDNNESLYILDISLTNQTSNKNIGVYYSDIPFYQKVIQIQNALISDEDCYVFYRNKTEQEMIVWLYERRETELKKIYFLPYSSLQQVTMLLFRTNRAIIFDITDNEVSKITEIANNSNLEVVLA